MDYKNHRLIFFLEAEVPEYFKTLSLKLYDVLQDICISTETRKHMMEEFKAEEKLESFVKRPKYSAHVFGSAYEGSQTRGMQSDVDTVYIDEELPVVIKTDNIKHDRCLLAIQDFSTPEGYAKLQLVLNGEPLTRDTAPLTLPFTQDDKYNICVDGQNRLVLSFCPTSRSVIGIGGRHGPALKQIMNKHIADKDVLFAFRSKELPKSLDQWFTRPKCNSWPSKSTIKLCGELGSLFVPTGHPNSNEKEIQWRLSLSHQERLLVTDFNLVQFMCFVLLKLVKKDIIRYLMERDSITSYHCKTCVFYVIENTPEQFWCPENLLAAFVYCIKTLLSWTQTGKCPNYFIPSENMFDKDIHGEVRQKLEGVLRSLMSVNCGYLLLIKTDDVGQRLMHSLGFLHKCVINKRQWDFALPVVELRKLDLHYTRLCFVLRTKARLLRKISSESPARQVKLLDSEIDELREFMGAENAMKDATGSIAELVISYLELNRLSTNVVDAVEKGYDATEVLSQMICDEWIEISLRTDRYSSKLAQASYIHAIGYFEKSLEILSQLDHSDCFSFCFCDQKRPIHPNASRCYKPEFAGMKAIDHLQRYIVPCINFTSGEMKILPDPLHWEFIHSVDKGYQNHDQSRTVAVDGIFLIHFLYYLNHSKLDMVPHAESDIRNMEEIVNNRKTSHTYTALNLLGWAVLQQGNDVDSTDFFRRSLYMKPKNNCASWHLKQIKTVADK